MHSDWPQECPHCGVIDLLPHAKSVPCVEYESLKKSQSMLHGLDHLNFEKLARVLKPISAVTLRELARQKDAKII